MPTLPEGYVRKGTLVYFQMDNDALQHAQIGAYEELWQVSLKLVRRDYALRQRWTKRERHSPQTPPTSLPPVNLS